MAAVQPFTDVVANNVPGQKGKEQSNIFLHGAHLFHSGLYLHYIIFQNCGSNSIIACSEQKWYNIINCQECQQSPAAWWDKTHNVEEIAEGTRM